MIQSFFFSSKHLPLIYLVLFLFPSETHQKTRIWYETCGLEGSRTGAQGDSGGFSDWRACKQESFVPNLGGWPGLGRRRAEGRRQGLHYNGCKKYFFIQSWMWPKWRGCFLFHMSWSDSVQDDSRFPHRNSAFVLFYRRNRADRSFQSAPRE